MNPKAVLADLVSGLWRRVMAPRMIYGVRGADGQMRAHSRISTHTVVEVPQQLALGDHVFIGHFNFIDASGGLTIGEGCQITNHVSVLTHSSHIALRVCGRAYWGHAQPPGLVRAPTVLGPYCFIGAHAVIAPGTVLGRGVLVKAYSYVSGRVPDFAVVEGQPARVVGDTRRLDAATLSVHPQMREHYERWAAAPPSP
jgi:acetyltransferase-like isoleucine patch superfamily enzyme